MPEAPAGGASAAQRRRPRGGWRRGAAALALAIPLRLAAAGLPDAEADAAEAVARPPAAAERGKGLARRPDERRPEVPFATTWFGRPLTLGGQYEATHQYRDNFDLDAAAARNRGRLDQELKLELFYRPGAEVSVFAQALAASELDTHRGSGRRNAEGGIERGQTWIYVDGLAGGLLGVQAGRIGLIEPRTWWWDDNRDALRLYLGGTDWLVETGLAREMARVSSAAERIDPAEQGVLRWFGRAAREWRRRHTVEAYWLAAADRSPRAFPGEVLHRDAVDASDARLRWLGLRAQGDARFAGGTRLGYWLDVAGVAGSESFARTRSIDGVRLTVDGVTTQRVRGQAIDGGLMWSLPLAGRPTLTAAYARGSGDPRGGDGVDQAFRQTGLHENKGRLRGVNRFRYYGELLRPDLSNLSVATLAFGFRFWNNSSLELVLHDYRQVHAARTLAASRLEASPDGSARHLGRELDLILGMRESRRLEFAARAALFRAGAAFAPRQGERSVYLELSVTLVF